MKDLIKILIWLFFISLAAATQTNRFLSLNGINPNLILLFILLAVILEKEFPKVLILVFIIILLLIVVSPYWSKPILVLGGLGLLSFLFKKFLTGSIFWDFLILIILGSLGFYLIIDYRYFFADPIAIIAELFYNVLLGIFLFLIGESFFYAKKTGIKS